MWTKFYQESSKRWRIWMAVSARQFDRWPAGSCLRFGTNHTQMISDFPQCAIPRVHNDQIVMKAWVRTAQFPRVQVTVKVRRACNPSHCIRFNPVCLFNARCTSICQNCMLLFVSPPSDGASWRIPYPSYALLWTPILMLSQHCSIETHNEYGIKWCGVFKILCATS